MHKDDPLGAMTRKMRKLVNAGALLMRRHRPWLFVVLFGVVGTVAILFSHAAIPVSVVEPDSGILVGGARKVNDTAASSGAFLQFGGSGNANLVIPTTIASDCAVDVAVSLNAWFATVPDGSTVDFPINGCYLLEAALKIQTKHNLTINGNGSTLKRTVYDVTVGKADMRHLHLADVYDSTVTNLKIVGQKDPTTGYAVSVEDQAGVGVFGCHHVVIDGFDIRHVHGDFVYVNKFQGTASDHIAVKNSVFTDSGRQGIAIIDGDAITVQSNNITNSDRYMIDLEPGGALTTAITNVTFDNNTWSGGGLGFLAGEGAGGTISNLVFSNNIVNGSMSWLINPPTTYRRGPISIINNTSTNGPRANLIELHAVDGVLIKDNHFFVKTNLAGNPAYSMLQISGSTGVQLINNITDNALSTVVPLTDTTMYCETGNTPATVGAIACL